MPAARGLARERLAEDRSLIVVTSHAATFFIAALSEPENCLTERHIDGLKRGVSIQSRNFHE